MNGRWRFGAVLLALAAAGCETPWVTIAPEVPTTARRLGPAHGESYAHILFGTPTYNVLPIGWNCRVARAYDDALDGVPGADALVGVTVNENWFWWVVGSARHLSIDGEAVGK